MGAPEVKEVQQEEEKRLCFLYDYYTGDNWRHVFFFSEACRTIEPEKVDDDGRYVQQQQQHKKKEQVETRKQRGKKAAALGQWPSSPGTF
ncbi:hypothetical protein OUZ56_015129 [Daphnia magna]|uniref:Uncharacterized protein n=1 Tax=Daphnia magna TaxID=35525 RepID=A0ABR0ALX1_9CRUS|nr:hypothetical protein OUZ56_015129 [Daphnia magna]